MFQRVKTVLILIPSLAITACSTAPGSPAPVSSATAKTLVAANDQDMKICRREVATGSVMPKTVCRTRAEWNRIVGTGVAEKDLLDSQRQARGLVSGGRGN